MSGTECTFVFVLDAKLKLSFSWFLFSHSSYGWSSNFSLKSSFISLRAPDPAQPTDPGGEAKCRQRCLQFTGCAPQSPRAQWAPWAESLAPGPQCPNLSHSNCSSNEIRHSSGSCCLHKWARPQPPESCAKHSACLNWKLQREKEYLGTTAPEKTMCGSSSTYHYILFCYLQSFC